MKQRRKISFDVETNHYLIDYMNEHHIRYLGDAIARICREHQTLKDEKQETPKQIVPVPSVEEMVEVFEQVEEKQAAKRGELVAAFLERYNK
ncbi:hypothetical protein ABEX44_12010 [Priestia megaterium]